MKRKIRSEAEAMELTLWSMGMGGVPPVPAKPGMRNGDYRCVTCKEDLPPGKPGRQCKACRASLAAIEK